jgi:hypothetical protein
VTQVNLAISLRHAANRTRPETSSSTASGSSVGWPVGRTSTRRPRSTNLADVLKARDPVRSREPAMAAYEGRRATLRPGHPHTAPTVDDSHRSVVVVDQRMARGSPEAIGVPMRRSTVRAAAQGVPAGTASGCSVLPLALHTAPFSTLGDGGQPQLHPPRRQQPQAPGARHRHRLVGGSVGQPSLGTDRRRRVPAQRRRALDHSRQARFATSGVARCRGCPVDRTAR